MSSSSLCASVLCGWWLSVILMVLLCSQVTALDILWNSPIACRASSEFSPDFKCSGAYDTIPSVSDFNTEYEAGVLKQWAGSYQLQPMFLELDFGTTIAADGIAYQQRQGAWGLADKATSLSVWGSALPFNMGALQTLGSANWSTTVPWAQQINLKLQRFAFGLQVTGRYMLIRVGAPQVGISGACSLFFFKVSPSTFSAVGQYNDVASPRALAFGPHKYGYSAVSCNQVCALLSYSLFALQAYAPNRLSWCSCSNVLADATRHGNFTGENCNGENSAWNTLGGIGCNYLYTTNVNEASKAPFPDRRPETYDFAYMGSYKDTSTRALRYGPQAYGYSPETCHHACKTLGYAYFALQYYNLHSGPPSSYCSCDSDWEHATMYGKLTEEQCAPPPWNGLGGWGCNQIYATKLDAITPTCRASTVYSNALYPCENAVDTVPSPEFDVGKDYGAGRMHQWAGTATGPFFLELDYKSSITSEALLYQQRQGAQAVTDRSTFLSVWASELPFNMGQLAQLPVPAWTKTLSQEEKGNLSLQRFNFGKTIPGRYFLLQVGQGGGIPGASTVYFVKVGEEKCTSYVEIGPYKDDWNRAMRHTAPGGYGYTADSCNTYCRVNGSYSLFALQDYLPERLSQCFCDNSLFEAQKYGSSTNCKARNVTWEKFGGSFCNYIYRTCPAPEIAMPTAASFNSLWVEIGPYKDTTSRAMSHTAPTGNAGYGYSPEACNQYCLSQNFAYFALQDYGVDRQSQCFCGSSLTEAKKYGSSTTCDTKFGGAWCNYIYETCALRYNCNTYEYTQQPPVEVRYVEIGAYGDAWSRAMSHTAPNSYGYVADTCNSYCLSKGYKLFALQDYLPERLSQCFCSSSLAASTMYGPSDNCAARNASWKMFGGGFCNYIFETCGSGQDCSQKHQPKKFSTSEDLDSSIARYVEIGPYKDDWSRAMTITIESAAYGYTATTCNAACLAKGAKYFGLQDYMVDQKSQCFCSSNLVESTQYGCSNLCIARNISWKKFGGPFCNYIFETCGAGKTCSTSSDYGAPCSPTGAPVGPVQKYFEIGPYKDSESRAMTQAAGGYGFDQRSCNLYCLDRGYYYFALQDYSTMIQSQCFCGNYLQEITKYGYKAQCNEQNQEWSKYGGAWCNYIYETCPKDKTDCSAESRVPAEYRRMQQEEEDKVNVLIPVLIVMGCLACCCFMVIAGWACCRDSSNKAVRSEPTEVLQQRSQGSGGGHTMPAHVAATVVSHEGLPPQRQPYSNWVPQYSPAEYAYPVEETTMGTVIVQTTGCPPNFPPLGYTNAPNQHHPDFDGTHPGQPVKQEVVYVGKINK